MTTYPFGLRQIAYSYCRLVTFKFPGFDGYQISLVLLLLAALCGNAFLASGRARGVVDRFCPPWLYCLSLVCALFVARLPVFLPANAHPDEAVFIAGAMKLRHHPLFWQSLDGTTSGPLNYYALTFLNLLGLPLDFATARLLNVLCIGSAIAVIYRIARLFMPDWAARLTPLPPLAAAMAFRDFEFLHYSSECFSVLLIALGTWLIFAEYVSNRPNWLRGVGIGAIAALLPLAKLQAAPIAMIIALGGIAQVVSGNKEHKWRRVFYISAGFVSVFASLLFYLLAFGVFEAFRQSYIVSNLQYANAYIPPSLERFLNFCFHQDLKWYESGILGSLLYFLGIPYYPWMRREGRRQAWKRFFRTATVAIPLYCASAWWLNSKGGLTWSLILAALLAALAVGTIGTVVLHRTAVRKFSFSDLLVLSILAASLYAVYRPQREHHHYLVFLIFPLALVGVRTLASSLHAANIEIYSGSNPAVVRSAIPFVVFTLVLPCLLRSTELGRRPASEAWMANYPLQLQCPVCDLVSHFTKPGDPVAIFGWAPEIYVSTGTLPATRDIVPPQIIGGPMQDYYRRRYFDDLQQHPPKVFVDPGPQQFKYQYSDAYDFESFPELRKYVLSNFYLTDEDGIGAFPELRKYLNANLGPSSVSGAVGGARVFVWRDASHQIKLPIRIKCGSGMALSDQAGNKWKADAYFHGGEPRHFQRGAATADLSGIYWSERSCAANCRYVIPIHNGTYLVRMYFAELDHSATNQRLFDMEVNRDAFVWDLDLLRAAHGRAAPYVLERRTTVSNDAFEIFLSPTVGEAEISAIEILPAPEIPAPHLQFQEITESEAGPLIDQVKWKAEPAWTLNSHYPDVGNLSSGQMWSSYGGDDSKTGRIVSGPLLSRSAGCLVIPVAHGPSVDQLSVALYDNASGQQIGVLPVNPLRPRWQLYQIRYDPAATLRLTADDRGVAWGQWLAVGQPRSCQ
jgi:hypothetical protein